MGQGFGQDLGYFKVRGEIHNRDTRNNRELYIPKAKTHIIIITLITLSKQLGSKYITKCQRN